MYLKIEKLNLKMVFLRLIKEEGLPANNCISNYDFNSGLIPQITIDILKYS